MREPARWMLDLGPRRDVADLLPAFGRAAAGVEPSDWMPPAWLYPHQRPAARRLAASLDAFGGALLADTVGLGKTWVALALAARAGSAVAVVPATLRPQWQRAARRVGLQVSFVTHEALSRMGRVPATALVIVDEAHHFRNPATRRYDRLARDLRSARVLLVTATPVVNRAADLHHLLRLFLPDNALAVLGVASLERALGAGRFEDVLHASAPLIVARTPGTVGPLPGAIPIPTDGNAVRAPPVAPRVLERVIGAAGQLRFPGFGGETPELLRRHLLHRLASSVEAARETAHRHRTYCLRARDAALRGEPLSRGAARRVFGDDDDGQMELLLPASGVRTLDPGCLDEELPRLDEVLDALACRGARPKERRFETLIRRRNGRKTLVFTAAHATAIRLAEVLRWRHVAVVTGSGARIAAGRIVAEEAFALFAPAARGRSPPPTTLRLDVLIATDLASEGLDLQDADAVVHYDLPWTPVRLAQRIGRIARLGSPHREVEVCWFVPAPSLERHLGLSNRLHRKVGAQVRLAVASTSSVGRARVVSAALEARERIARHANGATRGYSGHACTSEPLDVFALRWTAGTLGVCELVGLAGDETVIDYDRLAGCLSADAMCSPGADRGVSAPLATLVRQRLAAASRGPCDPASRRLARRILRRARSAAAARRAALLDLLDRALERVHAGLSVGEQRALGRLLGRPDPTNRLRQWLAVTSARRIAWSGCAVDAALVVTGPISRPCPD